MFFSQARFINEGDQATFNDKKSSVYVYIKDDRVMVLSIQERNFESSYPSFVRNENS